MDKADPEKLEQLIQSLLQNPSTPLHSPVSPRHFNPDVGFFREGEEVVQGKGFPEGVVGVPEGFLVWEPVEVDWDGSDEEVVTTDYSSSSPFPDPETPETYSPCSPMPDCPQLHGGGPFT